jgi:hypothetical protein
MVLHDVWRALFAGSVWLVLATIYVITMVLDRQRILSKVLHEHQYYFLGTLMFAFTVFYAYVTFSQYFIIWNANMPEETFYYVVREKGTWFFVSLVIIFGHFFLPFLALLRIDVKSNFAIMVPIAIWAWLMHFVDMTWNVMPIAFPEWLPDSLGRDRPRTRGLHGGIAGDCVPEEVQQHAAVPDQRTRASSKRWACIIPVATPDFRW